MKKYLRIAIAMMLALAMAMGTSAVYADEKKPDFELYVPYMDMTENCYETTWSINREYVYCTGAAEGEEPECLYEDCIDIQVTDADGNVIEHDGYEWTLPAGVYTFKWTNVDEVLEKLRNEWEYADNYNILTPTDTQFTVTVTGVKNSITFELYECSMTMFEGELLNLDDYEFIWFSGYGGGNSYEFPDCLQRYSGNYEYELTDPDGHVLTDEDLQQPLAAGVYTIRWSNVDEVKAAFDAAYDTWEYSYKYNIIFPDEPVVNTLEICNYDEEEQQDDDDEYTIPDDKPYFYWITAGVNLAGCDLMGANDFIWLTDLAQDEDNPDYILDNVELEYYDEEGNLLDLEYFANGMPEGEYTIVWVNYDEFWELNDSEGWGLDESYYVQIPIQDDYPTARLEIISTGIEYTGSAFSNSTLTVVLAGTVVVCLAVIAVLAVKLKKQQ